MDPALAPHAYGFFAVFGLSAFCILVHGLTIGRKLVMHDRQANAMAACAAWVERLRDWWSPPEGAEGDLELEVRRLAPAERAQRCKSVLSVGIHPFCMTVLVLGLQLVRQYGFQLQGAPFEELLHRSPFAMLGSVFPCAFVLYTFEDYVTPASFDVLTTFMLGRLVWEDMASDDALHLLSGVGLSSGARFMVPFFGRPSVSTGLNLVVSTVRSWRYATLLASLSPEDQGFVTGIHGPPQQVLFYELRLCALIGVICCGVELWSRASLRSRLKATAATTTTSRVKALMSMMCSSVVAVDRNLLLMEPSLQLADFLFRRPPSNSYKDTSLLQFVAEDDREYVRKQINPLSTGGEIPLSVSAKLVDGNGSKIRVRMYCTDITTEHGDKGYCIGILDDKGTALEGPMEDPQNSMGVASEDDLGDLRGFAAALQSASERDSESDATSMTGTSVASMEVQEARNGSAPFEVWVDMQHAQLPILQASAALLQIVGPIQPGQSTLIDWAPDLLAGLTMAFESYMIDSSEALSKVDIGRVRLEPKTAQAACLWYTARVTADFSKVQKAKRTTHSRPVVLRFAITMGVKPSNQEVVSHSAPHHATLSSASSSSCKAAALEPNMPTAAITPASPMAGMEVSL
eukprot:TRINITY_DN23260_c0_g2_i4.p1 TRINITY_DN23260_c0_g2~~TRINITY_DN23260_c0_g2_i4.p1  ORF type:complete len:631 (+),score=75.63 TRINITY_DN23260_c0_g2_i4:89-1981(+)